MTFVLDATNKSLRFTVSAGTDVHFTSHWADATASGFTEGQTQGVNTAGPDDVVPAPASSTRRVVKLITFHNTSTTTSRTVTLVNDVGGTSRTIAVFTLAPLATWYSDTAATTAIADGDKGDITVSGSGATWTIDSDAVTYAKMQNVSDGNRLLGRISGAGDVQEITAGTGILTWLQTPSSANLFSALTTKTGTGGDVVFATAPTITSLSHTGAATFANVADESLITINNSGRGDSLRINDVVSDTTPIVVTGDGQIVFGGATAISAFPALHIQSIPTSAFISGVDTTNIAPQCLRMTPTIPNIGTTMSSTSMVITFPSIESGAIVNNLFHFRAFTNNISGATVTNQYAFSAEASITGAVNNYGFLSAIPASANNFSFFSSAGAANSRFAGQVLYEAGSATAPSMTIDGDLNTGIAQIGGADTLSITTAGVERLRVAANGETFIAGFVDNGAYNLQVAGTGVWGAGAYVNGSDARIKTDIKPLTSGLDVVKLMRPVTFRYLPSFSTMQEVQPGFIAQELQTALAETEYVKGVVSSGSKYLNVAYQSVIPILVKAVQELSERLTALES